MIKLLRIDLAPGKVHPGYISVNSRGGVTDNVGFWVFLIWSETGFLLIDDKCLQMLLQYAGHFEIYSKPNTVPMVAAGLVKVKDKSGKLVERPYTCFDVADKLRSRGWVVPAYHLAPDAECAPPNHVIAINVS